MLQSIRDNSQGIVAKIIVGLIAVTFALFGVESLVSLTGGSNAPATVNGIEISQQELYQGVQLQRRQMLSQMGDDADPALLDENRISNMVLDSLVDQTILLQAAQSQGLEYTDAMIDQMIVSTKDFQVDGKFNRAQFESVLRGAGFSPLMYRQLVRKEKITEQERIAYLLSAFSLKPEIQKIASLDSQTRDIRYYTLPVPAADTLPVSAEDVAVYFDEHSSEFMTEEQVSIEYLLLDSQALAAEVEVSQNEIETAYQVLKDNYQGQEQRHAAHILVELSSEQDDAAAKAKADSLTARLAAGEEFSVLAQAESDDPASAELGGDLGINEKGVFSAEFEDALFSLEKGAVSAPVKTEFGYHLIKVLDVVTLEAPTLDESRAEIQAELLQEKIEELYVEKLEQLADISFSAGDLIEPSEALELSIQKTELFPRSGNEEEITSNSKVLAVAFDPELIKEGLNSTPIELDSGRAVVLRIADHQLPREKTVDEVSEQITELLKAQKASLELDRQATEILAKLAEGGALEAIASTEVITQTEMSRNEPAVAAEIRQSVFKMAKPDGKANYTTVDLLAGGKAIVALDAVKDVPAELKEEELKMMSMVLNSRQGQQDYLEYVNHLKSKATIEKL